MVHAGEYSEPVSFTAWFNGNFRVANRELNHVLHCAVKSRTIEGKTTIHHSFAGLSGPLLRIIRAVRIAASFSGI